MSSGVQTPTRHIIELILGGTRSDQLFERFCVRHYSKVENIEYVPTSQNYDLGRDGRTEFPRPSGGSYYICSSLTKKERVLRKAQGDLKTLLETDSRPGKVRFCYSA